MLLKAEHRSRPLWLQWIGTVLTFAGALFLIVGGVLPWARFRLLGTEISIPGVVEWGAVTIVVGILVLSAAGLRRRLPLFVMLLGFMSFIIGIRAHEETGKLVRGRMLGLENRLAPVNARL